MRRTSSRPTLFENNRARGGTLYGYSAVQLTRQDWQRHHGETWHPLREARRRYDPDSILASGPDLFRQGEAR